MTERNDDPTLGAGSEERLRLARQDQTVDPDELLAAAMLADVERQRGEPDPTATEQNDEAFEAMKRSATEQGLYRPDRPRNRVVPPRVDPTRRGHRRSGGRGGGLPRGRAA